MISILVISRCAAPPYPATPDFLHGKACHTILRSLCSLTNRVPLPPHPGDRINRSMLSCRDMAPLLSTHSPTAPRGDGGAVKHQRGKPPKWYVKYMTRCFSPQIPRFPLRWQGNWIHRGEKRPANPVTRFPVGERLEEAKGCTGQSTDRMLHRYPDRQSAACVIFASYPWTHPAAADTKKRRLFKGAVLLPIIWLLLQKFLLSLLYRKISSQSCKHPR